MPPKCLSPEKQTGSVILPATSCSSPLPPQGTGPFTNTFRVNRTTAEHNGLAPVSPLLQFDAAVD